MSGTCTTLRLELHSPQQFIFESLLNSLAAGVILKATPQQEKVTMKLSKGQQAPDFTLPSHLDKPVTLNHLRGYNVVLAFFPAAWTST